MSTDIGFGPQVIANSAGSGPLPSETEPKIEVKED